MFQKTRFPSTTSDVASRGTLIIPARHTDVVAVRLEAIPTNGGGEFLRVKRRSILWNEDTDRTNEEEEEEEEREWKLSISLGVSVRTRPFICYGRSGLISVVGQPQRHISRKFDNDLFLQPCTSIQCKLN